jgi:hypothetical protein
VIGTWNVCFGCSCRLGWVRSHGYGEARCFGNPDLIYTLYHDFDPNREIDLESSQTGVIVIVVVFVSHITGFVFVFHITSSGEDRGKGPERKMREERREWQGERCWWTKISRARCR